MTNPAPDSAANDGAKVNDPAPGVVTANEVIRSYLQTTSTIRCPECNCPNGWHSFGCATGMSVFNVAALATRTSEPTQ